MEILEALNEDSVWDTFLQYKLEGKHLSRKEENFWRLFIGNRLYRPVTEKLVQGGFPFDYPTKLAVNKSGTNKKRIVYTYPEAQSMVLKAMAFLLYRYDGKLSASCYSFRRNISAREAVMSIRMLPGLEKKYCLKADVHNYFNSIPPERLVAVLREFVTDDAPLVSFLERLLLAGKAYENGVLIAENRGAMAGIPVSPFFANIYLLSLDRLFEEKGIPYYRYSDDILIFADSGEKLEEYRGLLQTHIGEKGLSLNPEKVHVSAPGEAWDFLGFSYVRGKIELSRVTKDKLKAKIRRKARTLYRRRVRKNMDFETAAKIMIRTFNRKFYDEQEENAFTWSRWFFPVLTSAGGLRELDAYLVQYIRYLSSGRHYKGNYRVTYEQIKALGFRSLVHEYYLFKEKKL